MMKQQEELQNEQKEGRQARLLYWIRYPRPSIQKYNAANQIATMITQEVVGTYKAYYHYTTYQELHGICLGRVSRCAGSQSVQGRGVLPWWRHILKIFGEFEAD